jgi:hypothetical protein
LRKYYLFLKSFPHPQGMQKLPKNQAPTLVGCLFVF